jgi:tetratricopeptide (TPR) repeat protein
MMDELTSARYRAEELWRKAYAHQMNGDLAEAIELYRASLAAYPTAEAHTFLGWSLSFLQRYDEAIAECTSAIEIDPDFGNPYNDIGVYLMEQGHTHDAIAWLLKATTAPRYESPHFPWMNLGRAYEKIGPWREALRCYRRAIELEPKYELAKQALRGLIARMN